ncbi:hypothetical protein [Sphingobium lignivorans]|uniref:Uncharacterized protein n=1 Tax=Sphingobium lignivorans TaxID=2735886 RepID=A0ABR6NDH8_9SPHN|nr:hypothetical protein [Sphingobium lignivorans]MBB5985316.1 hypothetical protein [Sphingobium lignivorans]
MADIKHKIGAFNPETGTVPVTFTEGNIKHSRSVNAVLKAGGSYDRLATKARVDDVARGVSAKIAAGVIKPD